MPLYDDPSPPIENSAEEHQHRAAEQSYWRWQLIWQAVGALGALLAFAAAARYAHLANQQVTQMTNAAIAAKQSADAETAANRAWIVPAGSKTWTAGGQVVVKLNWANAGNTPATHIHGTEEYDVGWRHRAFRMGCEHLRNNGWQEYSDLLLPDDGYDLMSQSLPKEWNNSARVLNIHGCIWYTDVVTNTERTTEFCYEVVHNPRPWPVVVSPCLGGQFSDDQSLVRDSVIFH